MPIGPQMDLAEIAREARSLSLVLQRASTGNAQTELVDWIDRYRGVRDMSGAHDFQLELLERLQQLEAEKRAQERAWETRGISPRGASDALRRQHPELNDFESLRRTIRALRQVGDAIAWRFVHYDRLYLLAVARGHRTGAVPIGPGLAQELTDFESFWQNGQPALLRSLTTSMHWGDMTVYAPAGGIFVHESTAGRVKGKRKRDQSRNAIRREQFLMTGLDLVGGEPRTHVALDVPFGHELHAIGRACQRALEEGAACEPLGDWGSVSAMSLERLASLPTADAELVAAAAGNRRQELIGAEDRCVLGWSQDRQQLAWRGVSYAAFPFPSDIVARLLTGRLIIATTINMDHVARYFGFVSRRTQVCLPPAADGAWLRVRYHSGMLGSFRDFEFVRVLYEAMHPQTLVTAAMHLHRVLPPAGVRVHYTFGLKDEVHVWA